ncbi:hypothetical protein Slala01_34470 [Streptomyces lavendulae subsp. lavendulae]|nr:hypothetical protein Slala01_34470 [Streptomyces lavendulae subsp. lavendulae]
MGLTTPGDGVLQRGADDPFTLGRYAPPCVRRADPRSAERGRNPPVWPGEPEPERAARRLRPDRFRRGRPPGEASRSRRTQDGPDRRPRSRPQRGVA